MIYGDIKEVRKLLNNFPNITEALEFILKTDFSYFSSGSTQFNTRGDIAIIFKKISEKTEQYYEGWEVHEKHIDVHFVYEGEELLGVAYDKDVIAFEKYNKDNDVSICKANGSLVKLNPQRVAIIFPNEVHKAGIYNTDGEIVNKVVLKLVSK